MHRLLIIDDDEGITEALGDVMRDAGYTVEAVLGGHEALARLAEPPSVDLILLDLTMPGMDGFEFRARALASERLRSIPVIVLTAGLMKDPAALHRLRVAACLGKTTPVDVLLATIARVLAVAAGAGSVSV